MSNLTCSNIAKKLSMPLSKVRRNANIFLPSKRYPKGCGQTREFTHKQAIILYISVRLVSGFGYSFNEAKKVLNKIKKIADLDKDVSAVRIDRYCENSKFIINYVKEFGWSGYASGIPSEVISININKASKLLYELAEDTK